MPPADSGATVDPTMNLAPGDPGATVDPTLARSLMDSGATVDPTLAGSSDSALKAAPSGQTAAPGIKGGSNADFSLAGPLKKTVSTDRSIVPGYEILGELGRGGMGVVYKARQRGLNRLVALKMILAGGPRRRPSSWTASAPRPRPSPSCSIRTSCRSYEVGEHDGLPYFSLEFVEGGSLAGQDRRQAAAGPGRPPSWSRRWPRRWHCAHQHGIIHRDLKPANILLTPGRRRPRSPTSAWPSDSEEDSSQTQTGTVMGTPSYMAPEQARGDTRAIGPPADVYALGAILYELLTGRPPFQGTTDPGDARAGAHAGAGAAAPACSRSCRATWRRSA